MFHSLSPDRIEVLDAASDLILFDAERSKSKPLCTTPELFETFPSWSQDGATLYYCVAESPYSDAPTAEKPTAQLATASVLESANSDVSTPLRSVKVSPIRALLRTAQRLCTRCRNSERFRFGAATRICGRSICRRARRGLLTNSTATSQRVGMSGILPAVGLFSVRVATTGRLRAFISRITLRTGIGRSRFCSPSAIRRRILNG